jgi:hypothetical protein
VEKVRPKLSVLEPVLRPWHAPRRHLDRFLIAVLQGVVHAQAERGCGQSVDDHGRQNDEGHHGKDAVIVQFYIGPCCVEKRADADGAVEAAEGRLERDEEGLGCLGRLRNKPTHCFEEGWGWIHKHDEVLYTNAKPSGAINRLR